MSCCFHFRPPATTRALYPPLTPPALEAVMMVAATIDQQIDSGAASVEGERFILDKLAGMLVQFELDFEVMPGTGTADLTPERTVEADTPALTNGG